MNRMKSRTSAVTLAAFGLATAVTLTGCSSGQVSQSANQLPAVNGTATTIGGDPEAVTVLSVKGACQRATLRRAGANKPEGSFDVIADGSTGQTSTGQQGLIGTRR